MERDFGDIDVSEWLGSDGADKPKEAAGREGKSKGGSVAAAEIGGSEKKHEYKPHEFRPKHEKNDGKRNFFLHHYDRNYKKLLVIPLIVVIASMAILLHSNATTGEYFQKDVSIRGGATVTILKNYDNLQELEKFLSSEAGTTVNVRRLSEAGISRGIIVDAGIEEEEKIDNLISLIQQKTGTLERDEFSVQVIGSSLGASFFSQVVKSILFAFVFMGLVVFIYFRFAAGSWIIVPSFFVVWTILVDIISTLAVVSLLGIPVSTAGLAAFLLLIGYSVDTDILLTMRMLKSRHESIFDRVLSAARTGIFMTLAGMAAITVGLLVTQSDTIRQIMLILFIGLAFDLVHTWLTNTGILRWYLERNRYEA